MVAFALALGVLSGCPPKPAEPQQAPPDRSLTALDRLIRSGDAPRTLDDLRACIDRIDRAGVCTVDRDPEQPAREIAIRLALDPRYTKWPQWQQRLDDTLGCVNRLYQPTGVQWELASITPWEAADVSHQLYALLARLQRDFPPDHRSVTLGMVVWDERQVYSKAGGEIGLSQASACVVPSWPRVENDCLILAHELGHLIGARHVAGKQWVMGWAARPFFLPADDPLARVTAVYRFHPVNVAMVTAHRTARYTRYGLRPTGGCRQRVALIRRCWWGR